MSLSSENKDVVEGELNVDNSFSFKLVPISTEKSTNSAVLNKYFFKTQKCLDKTVIGSIIKKRYNVDVVSINTLIVSNKKRTIKYNRGYQKPFKKVIVTLKKGQVISDLK